jgi:phosphate starvation-inducible protein PhoH and related proteins
MEKVIKIESNREAQLLSGAHDSNLKTLEKEFRVKINMRGERLKLSGTSSNISKAADLLAYLLHSIRLHQDESQELDLHHLIRNFKDTNTNVKELSAQGIHKKTKLKVIGPKTKGQREYVEAIKNNDIICRSNKK